MEHLLGTIIWFAGTYIPIDFAEANGQSLSIKNNPALFSLIGIRYGGDGINNFRLPDLRPIEHHGDRADRAADWSNGPRALIVIKGIYPSRP